MSTDARTTEPVPAATNGEPEKARPASFAEEALRLGGKGAEEVRRWPFEVWNEPNLDGFWERADQRAYFDLYARTAKAIKAIDPQLRVGGPSTAGAATTGTAGTGVGRVGSGRGLAESSASMASISAGTTLCPSRQTRIAPTRMMTSMTAVARCTATAAPTRQAATTNASRKPLVRSWTGTERTPRRKPFRIRESESRNHPACECPKRA